MNHRSLAAILLLVLIAPSVPAQDPVAEAPQRPIKAEDAKGNERAGEPSYIGIRSTLPEAMTKDRDGRLKTVVNYGLKYADEDRLMTVPGVWQMIPVREVWKTFRYENRAMEGRVVGTTLEYAEAADLKMTRGRFLTLEDDEKVNNVAVLGSEAADTLFAAEDAFGKSVKIGTDYYTVIGVAKERPENAGVIGRLRAQHFNSDIYIPLNTCRLRFGERVARPVAVEPKFEETQLTRLIIRVRDDAPAGTLPAGVKAAIEQRHLGDGRCGR